MTSDEAKQALKEGKNVRSVNWVDGDYLDEYIEAYAEKIFKRYKDDEWEIVE